MEDWKQLLGQAFGIDPETAQPDETHNDERPADALAQQGKSMVNIVFEKKGRAGKQATIITDLLADDEALKRLASELKQHCSTGGSARGGEILLQGDCRDKALEWLRERGFKARII
ncbi:MAG: translation initiation factor [Muribaculaceae bacterium]|nr:translation initiation factor [Muribaculaceae bacterium]